MDVAHVVAASDILGKTGTKVCVTFLEEAMLEMPEMDEQKQNSLQAAIDEIKKRL
jgi:hypothetical protein